ncbi:MAG: DEAD/DEAH box helicase [Pseudomonadota bacterium]
MSFSELGLSQKVLTAVEAAGYTEPTPIQARAIPFVLQRRDVIGIAQTGTGKTASFTLPMLSILEKGRPRARMPRSLILEPTRELAAQVAENIATYGSQHKLTVALLIGGVSFDEQDRKLDRGADIVIATPGRLLDHFERGKLLLQGVEVLVIDEADRMLDMGFIPDIERICSLIPFTRQTLFFSATMAPEIQRLTDTFLQNPEQVEVAPPSSTAATVTQKLVASAQEDYRKRETLRRLLREAEDLQNALIFCNRKRDVSLLFRSLEKHGLVVGALHGDMDQRARMLTLENFKNGKIPILVASDVAARGLDIPAVSHVFNFDTPHNAEDYVHRIGRTGRAGREGTAITIVTTKDRAYLDAIEALIGRQINWDGDSVFDNPPPAESRSSDRKSSGKPRKGDRATEPDRPTEGSRGPKRRNRRDRDEENDTPVIGMGDHVPDFLLRPLPDFKTKKSKVA